MASPVQPAQMIVTQSDGDLVGNSPGGYYHGPFWPNAAGTDLGAFFWQCWICPIPGGDGYFVRDSVGGDHTFLVGTAAVSGGHQFTAYNKLAGVLKNFNSAATDIIRENEWTHVAWSLSNNTETADHRAYRIWLNGILSHYTYDVGDRDSVDNAEGLFTLGWNHQGWAGRIATLQGWDNNADAFGSYQTSSIGLTPTFGLETVRANVAGTLLYPDISLDYTGNGPGVQDYGINQIKLLASLTRRLPLHPGYASNATINTPDLVGTLPRRVQDSSCPVFTQNPHGVQGASFQRGRTSAPTDKTYLVWDSFGNRRNSPIENRLPTMGNTETGTLGPLAWLYVPPTSTLSFQWGVCWGYGINLSKQTNSPNLGCYVDCGTANHGVQSSMVPDATLQGALLDGPGVILRRVDQLNLWTAYTIGNTCRVRKYVAGVTTDHDFTMVTGYDSLRVTVNSSNLFTAFSGTTVSGTTTWTSIGTFTDAAHATGTRVGMCNHQPNSVRRSSFGVFATS